MKFANTALIAIVSFCAQLLFPLSGAAESIATAESTPREQIVDSLGAPDDLVLATFYRLVSGSKILGALLV